MAALLLVASGWRPRFTGILHWWVSVSFQASAVVVEGGDQVAAVLSLLLIPITLTDARRWHWSPPLRAALSQTELSKRLWAGLAHALVRLQVAGIYFHAALGKLTVPEWKDGTAMYYWGTHEVFGAPDWLMPLFKPLVTNGSTLAPLTWSVILLEISLAFAFLMKRMYQRVLLYAGIAFHIGIIFIHSLPSFGLIMIGALVLYLYPLSAEVAFTWHRGARAQTAGGLGPREVPRAQRFITTQGALVRSRFAVLRAANRALACLRRASAPSLARVLLLSLVVAGCSDQASATAMHGDPTAAAVPATTPDAAASVQLPSFRDVSDAPEAVQLAARAVVRIQTAQSSGTASFISQTGLLLTNNHVIGVGICARAGCYAQIRRMYQRGAPPQPSETVYVVPIAVDVGLDFAVVQAFAGAPDGPKLASSSYLTLDPRESLALRGTHVNIVGHPEGRLKKWSEGQVVDSMGESIWATAFSLPGSSGSPILDDFGNLIGLLHSGPSGNDMITAVGVNEYSIGTASAPIVAAMSAPLPGALLSTAASMTDAEVVANHLVYLNAHVDTAFVDGKAKAVLASLGEVCDTQLARMAYGSSGDFATAVSPCVAAILWCECRGDATAHFGVCPSSPSDWSRRYRAIFDRLQALNGSLYFTMITFAPAALASSVSAGMEIARQAFDQALISARPGLDFDIVDYLAALNIDSYGGTRAVDFLRAYKTFSGYELWGVDIVNTALQLNQWGKLSTLDLFATLRDLASDATVDLRTKLYVEQLRYDFRILV